MSLFGAEAAAPEPADLGGLLAGTGRVVRIGGAAQVSISVDHPWRASVLVAECGRRGLAATCVSRVDQISVRTAYSPLLLPLAEAWLADGGPLVAGADDAAVRRVPRDFMIDGWLLRLWVEAEGRREGPGAYVLPVGHRDEQGRDTIGAALAAVGLAPQFVSPRGGGPPLYRIVGKRRLNRLVEMVGDPPKQAPADIWPS